MRGALLLVDAAREMDYVRRVRAARGALNLSLDKFAQQLGMGRSTLVRIENGSREPTLDEYEAMAEASGLPLRFFIVDDLTDALEGDSMALDQYTEVIRRLERLRVDSEKRLERLEAAVADLTAPDGDAAKRFADAVRREAQQQNGHPGQDQEGPRDADAGGRG